MAQTFITNLVMSLDAPFGDWCFLTRQFSFEAIIYEDWS